MGDRKGALNALKLPASHRPASEPQLAEIPLSRSKEHAKKITFCHWDLECANGHMTDDVT